jgi:hypothetical protein
MEVRVSSDSLPRAAWANYAAGAWTVLFAAPHLWWALGIPAGMPGGVESHRLMMTTWRYWFDVLVVALSVVGVTVAIGLVRPRRALPHGVLRVLAWMAAVLLSLRGLAGLIVDGTRDPVWWPTFLTGGVLFTVVAWRSRAPAAADR